MGILWGIMSAVGGVLGKVFLAIFTTKEPEKQAVIIAAKDIPVTDGKTDAEVLESVGLPTTDFCGGVQPNPRATDCN